MRVVICERARGQARPPGYQPKLTISYSLAFISVSITQ